MLNSIKNKYSKIKINDVLIVILLIVFTILLVPIEIQNDTFFSINTGKSIIDSGFYNIENLTIHEGLTYKTIHPMFDIIIYFINLKLGFGGIHFFVCIIACITIISIYFLLLKCKIPKTISCLVVYFIMYLGYHMFTVRAQIISFLCMIYIVYFIKRLVETNKTKYMLYIILLHFIIVNFHLSIFLLSFLIYVPYLLEYIIKSILIKYGDLDRYKFKFENYNMKKLIITIFLSLLVGLLNPYGIYTYTYLFTTLGGISNQVIVELKQPTFIDIYIIVTIIAIMFFMLLFRKTKVKFVDFVFVLMYFICCFFALRFIFYFIFLIYLSISNIICNFIKSNSDETYDRLKKYNYSKKMVCAIFLVMIIISSGTIYINLKSEYVNDMDYPIKSVNWVKHNLNCNDLRMYNNLNYGSYIEYCGVKAFIDSRTEIFDSNENRLLEDIYKIENMQMTYNELFEKYNLNYALVNKEEPLYKYVSTDKNYIKIYEDNYFEIYSLNRNVI